MSLVTSRSLRRGDDLLRCLIAAVIPTVGLQYEMADGGAAARTPEEGGLDPMTRGRTISWTLGGLALGVVAGFAAELLRRQPAAKVQQRYVAPPASETTEAAPPAPSPMSNAEREPAGTS
jgi:hypothetical protein